MSPTLDANVMPGMYKWRALDIPEPEPDMGDPINIGVPLDAQDVIQDALTNLIERLGGNFYILPQQDPAIYSPDSERDQINREMGQVRSIMLAIKYDLCRRVALLGKRRNAMSIFNRLPSELAGHVFMHALEPVPHILYDGILSANYRSVDTLKNIGSVSTGWWNVTRSCPALWTTIVFEPGENVKQKLRMSGTLPLTIIATSLHFEHHDPTYYPHISLPFLDSLIAHSSRWESVQLYLRTVDELDRVREALRSPTGIGTSSLRRLSVERVVLDPNSPALKTVEELTMRLTDLMDTQRILKVLRSTVLLKLLNVFWDEGEPALDRIEAQHPIHLPSLEEFTPEETDFRAIELLAGIYAEGLLSISVGYPQGDREEEHMVFQELIRPRGQSSIISSVIENSDVRHLEMNIGANAHLFIVGKAPEVEGPLYVVWIKLTSTRGGWGHHFENMVNFPKFAASLPPIHLNIDDMPLTFLLSIKTVTSLAMTTSAPKCAELFRDILGHAHRVGEDLVWACPNLNEIQLLGDTHRYLDAFETVMRNALEAREETEGPEKPLKITVKRPVYRGWITVT